MIPLPVYDWQEPAHLQEGDWDCSQESLEWCLWAYGRTPDDSWMEQSMQAAGAINPEVGCTDASGAGLVRWLNDQYQEYGYLASNQTGVSFEQVRDEARTHRHPLAMGGLSWGHWTGVRSWDELLDRLVLANPAPGYKGAYQTLTRAQFSALGPFNLVRLTCPAVEDGGTVTAQLAGPDVASHQGVVEWSSVRAAGASFGFTKASGGCWYRNPTLAPNWAGMAAAGLQRGAYHFAFETSGQPLPGPGPEAEADYFLGAMQPLGLARGDMLVLDIEQGAGPLGQWALRWLRRVEQAVGFKPLLYTGDWFASAHGFSSVPELAAYPLWQAAYQPTIPPPCAPWSQIAFWQFTDQANVPGIAGPCDGNRFQGSAAQLAGMGKPGGGPVDDPYAPWVGLIGSGLLDMMRADNTLPAQSRSTWLPLGQSPADIEQAVGQNGIAYGWTVSTTNTGFRYRPE
jgi:lysozyme